MDLHDALRETLDDVRLSRSERRSLSALLDEADLDARGRDRLRQQAFVLAREALAHPPSTAVLAWLEDVMRLLVGHARTPEPASAMPVGEVCFSPGTDCLRAILKAFQATRQRADICVFTITDDRISDGIRALHRRGVRVRIVADHEKGGDPGADVLALQREGLAVHLDRAPGHMHHKFAIFDGRTVLTGSYNWTRAAERVNRENLLLTDDPRLVAAYQGAFEDLWPGT